MRGTICANAAEVLETIFRGFSQLKRDLAGNSSLQLRLETMESFTFAVAWEPCGEEMIFLKWFASVLASHR